MHQETLLVLTGLIASRFLWETLHTFQIVRAIDVLFIETFYLEHLKQNVTFSIERYNMPIFTKRVILLTISYDIVCLQQHLIRKSISLRLCKFKLKNLPCLYEESNLGIPFKTLKVITTLTFLFCFAKKLFLFSSRAELFTSWYAFSKR